MNRFERQAPRVAASLMGGLCTIALFPAALGAYVGSGWLDLPMPARLSAAALVAAPLPLALGTFLACKAAATQKRWPLVICGACILFVIALYAAVWAWGGRMLI
ncbi:MAG TPA: hypothetical protein VKI45_09890 [Allosphingosinicella sp.]|nr:hypothetical protein [Allosphingosinicella sp.]